MPSSAPRLSPARADAPHAAGLASAAAAAARALGRQQGVAHSSPPLQACCRKPGAPPWPACCLLPSSPPPQGYGVDVLDRDESRPEDGARKSGGCRSLQRVPCSPGPAQHRAAPPRAAPSLLPAINAPPRRPLRRQPRLIARLGAPQRPEHLYTIRPLPGRPLPPLQSTSSTRRTWSTCSRGPPWSRSWATSTTARCARRQGEGAALGRARGAGRPGGRPRLRAAPL